MAGFFRQIALEHVGVDGETIAAIGSDTSSCGDPDTFFCAVIRGTKVVRPRALRLSGVRTLAAASHAPIVAIGSDDGQIRVVDIAKDELRYSGAVKETLLSLALDETGDELGVIHRKGEGAVLVTIALSSKKKHELAHGELSGLCHARGAFWTSIQRGRKFELVPFAGRKRGTPFPLGGSPYALARALHANVIAAGVGKKNVVVIDLDSGKSTRISAHEQKDAYAAVDVAISHDGAVVVSRGSHDERLVVTSEGKSRTFGKLSNLEEPYGTDMLWTTPGFAASGRTITTFDGSRVVRHALV